MIQRYGDSNIQEFKSSPRTRNLKTWESEDISRLMSELHINKLQRFRNLRIQRSKNIEDLNIFENIYQYRLSQIGSIHPRLFPRFIISCPTSHEEAKREVMGDFGTRLSIFVGKMYAQYPLAAGQAYRGTV